MTFLLIVGSSLLGGVISVPLAATVLAVRPVLLVGLVVPVAGDELHRPGPGEGPAAQGGIYGRYR